MILLYKKGSTHNVRGIDCELLRCKPKEMDFYLSQGYAKSPEELVESHEPVPAEVVETTEEPVVATEEKEEIDE